MSQPALKTSIQRNVPVAAFLLLSLTLLQIATSSAQAESLFRVSTTKSVQEPLKPRSLFFPPISHQVGDIVTITVTETTTSDTTAELKVTRTQQITQNGSSLFNNMVGFFLGKVGLNNGTVRNTLTAPNFNGLNNNNTQDSKAEALRNTTIADNITCQVVQVLPNGDLMVQGQKVVQYNKERGNLIVTGIVNPFYLDKTNQISSKQVANFQMVQAGKGVISRQQTDGIANKIYQFFN